MPEMKYRDLNALSKFSYTIKCVIYKYPRIETFSLLKSHHLVRSISVIQAIYAFQEREVGSNHIFEYIFSVESIYKVAYSPRILKLLDINHYFNSISSSFGEI